MTLILQRGKSTADGTFGILLLPSGETFISLELPYNLNIHNSSSIPQGTYEVIRSFSPKFEKKTYILIGVPGRDSIRIHSANVCTELRGCISLGIKLGVLNGKKAVLMSRQALEQFESLMDKKPFTLEIRDYHEIEIQVS
jgi:hypothetical protein